MSNNLEELIKDLLKKIDEQNKKIQELEAKLSEQPVSKPLSELIREAKEGTELSQELKEKIAKLADLVIKYGQSIDYLKG
ncbi:MAG: hypothetical protein QXK24_00265 [Ignisphaera sp.]